ANADNWYSDESFPRGFAWAFGKTRLHHTGNRHHLVASQAFETVPLRSRRSFTAWDFAGEQINQRADARKKKDHQRPNDSLRAVRFVLDAVDEHPEPKHKDYRPNDEGNSALLLRLQPAIENFQPAIGFERGRFPALPFRRQAVGFDLVERLSG